MTRPKIITVIGARPQFVKAAEVTLALAGHAVEEVFVHTGQHYDPSMSDVFFRELRLNPPKHNLGVGSGSHGQQTGRMLERIEQVIIAERPQAVLVYGDTNSTLAGALAAAKLHIPVFHVEAGLRSFNRRMPEEINRVMTDHVSTLLFCPTRNAMENLRREGIPEDRIVFSGDVMLDSVLRHAQAADPSLLHPHCARGDAVLVTLHRAENTDEPNRLAAIASALVEISRRAPVVFPLHPRTRAALERAALLDRLSAFVACIEPLGYRDMIAAQKNAALVITDSGGVQKEAFFLGTPSLVVRRETEWVELVELGCAKLVEPETLASAAAGPHPPCDATTIGIYGDGRAAEHICAAVSRFLA